VAPIQPLKLRFAARARSQLLAIEEYLQERSPGAARRIGAEIRDATELLQFFPHAGRSGRSEGTREWVVTRTPYVLVYSVDDVVGEVVILGLFHGAQRR
jgi:toxin ParE1/3/4